MRKFIYFLVCNFLYPNPIFSQSSEQIEVDSLIDIVSSSHAFEKLGEKEVLRITTEIYYRSKNIDYKKGQLKALDYRSNVYYNTGKISQGLDDLEEGLRIAKKLDDHYELAYMMFGKAFCYTKLGLFKKSFSSAKKGFEYAENIKDRNKYHYVRLSLYNAMMWNAHYSKNTPKKNVLKYSYYVYNEAKSLDQNFPDSYGWVVQSASNYAAILLIQNKNKQYAENLISEADKLSCKVNDTRTLTSLSFVKGLLADKNQKHEEAIENYKESIDLAKMHGMIYELPYIYSQISKSYETNGDYKNASIYLNRYKTISDSLAIVEKKAVEFYYNEKSKKEISLTYILIISCFILFPILIYLLIKKHKKPSIKSETKNQETINFQPDSYSKIIQLIEENNQSFYLQFKDLFPEFILTLLSHEPSLKSSDLEYCALIRFNFDTKQIAIFKNISIKAVENKKYRLKKKLQVPIDENLYSWIEKIDL